MQTIGSTVFSCGASRNKQDKQPAPGFRYYNSGALISVGGEGSVWSATANEAASVYLRFVVNAAQPNHLIGRVYGFQLRCLSE
ncbi:hypothetical protein [uncultured Rikenella sp.]|uniref:hypothetical protein n=2 Tax=uncultured Rikenella sp. TaxID=368003 RepID=UPI00262632BC|nr:hypothetical protein [uncultured Rikenella sp.]